LTRTTGDFLSKFWKKPTNESPQSWNQSERNISLHEDNEKSISDLQLSSFAERKTVDGRMLCSFRPMIDERTPGCPWQYHQKKHSNTESGFRISNTMRIIAGSSLTPPQLNIHDRSPHKKRRNRSFFFCSGQDSTQFISWDLLD
jgi:hypothetical protein